MLGAPKSAAINRILPTHVHVVFSFEKNIVWCFMHWQTDDLEHSVFFLELSLVIF
jgi:hypothetical protein